MRRILGVDPGIANTGYGILEYENNKFKYIAHGVIETDAKTEHSERLKIIYESLDKVVKQFKPTEASIEGLFFSRNVTSAMSVAESRGVILLCFAKNKLDICEYTPNNIKQSVCGNANADKKLVQDFVKLLLGLPEIPKPDHAADALAAAITKAHSSIRTLG